MSRAMIERRLSGVADRLRRLRDELAIVDEQLDHLSGEADDARLRALVSETPLAGQEHRAAQRHADAMAKHRTELKASIAKLEVEQDELLDRLLLEQRGSTPR